MGNSPLSLGEKGLSNAGGVDRIGGVLGVVWRKKEKSSGRNELGV